VPDGRTPLRGGANYDRLTKPGNKLFEVEYLESVVEEDIPALSQTINLKFS
jgi:hypothetical protein